MKPKLIPLIDRCIENGAARGWRIAHKHNENPTEESVKESIREAIWNELYEAFEFDDPII